jgi:hypothetical protein
MKIELKGTVVRRVVRLAYCLALSACSSDLTATRAADCLAPLNIGAEQRLGKDERNPSTPLLSYAPDSSLFPVWTQDDDSQSL